MVWPIIAAAAPVAGQVGLLAYQRHEATRERRREKRRRRKLRRQGFDPDVLEFGPTLGLEDYLGGVTMGGPLAAGGIARDPYAGPPAVSVAPSRGGAAPASSFGFADFLRQLGTTANTALAQALEIQKARLLAKIRSSGVSTSLARQYKAIQARLARLAQPVAPAPTQPVYGPALPPEFVRQDSRAAVSTQTLVLVGGGLVVLVLVMRR